VEVSIGSLTLGLPRDVGVAIHVNRFLASFAAAGFTKRGQTYYTRNYNTARYRLSLQVSATIGGIDVNWID
jgi:predicted membrane protein